MTFDMTTEKSMRRSAEADDRGADEAAEQRMARRRGKSSNHVTMFHTIAPMRPAKINSGVIQTTSGPL